MTAFAYIKTSNIPRPLLDTAARRTEGSDRLIAFVGCPLTGVEQDDSEIRFPWPQRAWEIREAFVEWLCHWRLSFHVEQD
ncbi:hypothetical protein [Caballeronia glebae]|uniref:hypothetical protein n=1 Tax=Caballeronia glebae TaxID=1777143 RepID=UPI0038B99C05